jgi:two-component system, OmpR family, sensor kinase
VSLRARILLATAVVALVALVVADFATYAELRSFLYGQVDDSLEMTHIAVENSISGGGTGESAEEGGESPSPPGAPSPYCPSFDGMDVDTGGLSPGTVIEVRSPSGHPLYRCGLAVLGSKTVAYPVLPGRITGFAANAADFDELTVYFSSPATSGPSSFRVRASVLRSGPAVGDQLIVAVPLASTAGTLHRLLLLEATVTGAALVGALLLGWWLVRVSLAPLRRVEHTAGAITEGQFTERVPGDQARTEVGRLSRALNVMLERIEGAFAQRDRTEAELRASEERMRRFVADASHELRTPLAAVTAYAELFDQGAARRPHDLERVLSGIREESARMGHLVEDLVLLARLDEGRPLQLEPVDLVELAGAAATTARAVGPEWPVRIQARQPVEVLGDRLRLRQVLDNLLANVRTHCPEGTTATITITSSGDRAQLQVADDGPGLGEEEATRIFERFHRSDPSRSRHHGGAGLGLAIVAAIVRAHGGTVGASPAVPGGAVFTISLPRLEDTVHDDGDPSAKSAQRVHQGVSRP